MSKPGINLQPAARNGLKPFRSARRGAAAKNDGRAFWSVLAGLTVVSPRLLTEDDFLTNALRYLAEFRIVADMDR
ncbi:MAG: hypothetical protein WBW31_06500 [Candidatus Sulfotelmatobacter sp.]